MHTHQIIREVEISAEINDLDLHEYINIAGKAFKRYGGFAFKGVGFDFTQLDIDTRWKYDPSKGLSNIVGLFVQYVGTEERLTITNPPDSISLMNEPPEHPIHIIQKIDHLEKAYCNHFNRAFGTDLILNRAAGSKVPFHVGKKPEINNGEDRVSLSYIEKLEKIPYLHHQGDGMRSFVGLLLHTFCTHQKIVLIDEPEAFLHPAQAKILGQMITAENGKSKQLFIATHSADFIKGVLDAKNSNIRIIRLDRKAEINHVRTLDAEEISKIWEDSLLRHSNILEGLFHSKVVVCESDSDCRFYSALVDTLHEQNPDFNNDVLFIHCGGKHRLHVVVSALSKLGVKIAVIADIDILNDAKLLQTIVELNGGNWSQIAASHRVVHAAITKVKPQIEAKICRERIIQIFDSITEAYLSDSSIERLKGEIKKSSPWAIIKQAGKSAMPSGDEFSKYEEMERDLKKSGVFVVPVGELEGFAKRIPGHGPSWVNSVLNGIDLAIDPELEVARKFVREVIDF